MSQRELYWEASMSNETSVFRENIRKMLEVLRGQEAA